MVQNSISMSLPTIKLIYLTKHDHFNVVAWLTHLRYTYFFFTALVPDEVKREMLIKIRSFLAANS